MIFKNKWKTIIIGIIIFFVYQENILAKDDINITGKAVKILDVGDRIKNFKTQDISIHSVSENNKLLTGGHIYSQGGFEFKSKIARKYIGKKLQFKINEKWFILSPFDGKFFLPISSQDINILIISKDSEIYLKLFTKIDYYTIQVSSIHSRIRAKEMVNDLRKYCMKKEGKYYCNKYVKFSPYVKPNSDTLYKVQYNIYYSKKKADNDLIKIKNKFKALNGAFVKEHLVVDTDLFKNK